MALSGQGPQKRGRRQGSRRSGRFITHFSWLPQAQKPHQGLLDIQTPFLTPNQLFKLIPIILWSSLANLRE